MAGEAGAVRHARNVSLVADEVGRLLQGVAALRRDPFGLAGPQAQHDDAAACGGRPCARHNVRHGRRPRPGTMMIEKYGASSSVLSASGTIFWLGIVPRSI